MRSALILLAAGESSRMGSPKALLPWRGRPLLQHQVEEIQASRVDACVVVLGHDAARLEPLVTLAGRSGWKSRAIVNPRPEEGRAASLRTGAREVGPDHDAIVVASVDQPLDRRLLDRLLQAAEGEWSRGRGPEVRSILIPICYGRRGHPTLLRGDLHAELLAAREEGLGLREVIRRDPGRVLEIEWLDPAILLNLNVPEDRGTPESH